MTTEELRLQMRPQVSFGGNEESMVSMIWDGEEGEGL